MSAAGEKYRIEEQIARMRALITGLEMGIGINVPLSESAQAVADASIRLVAAAARHDAYQRAGKK